MKHLFQFKTVLLITFLGLFSVLSYGQGRYQEDKIIVKDKIILLKSDLTPLTGIVCGEKQVGSIIYRLEYSVENGVLEGAYKWYYESGQMQQLEFYRDGKRVGPLRRWWMNGNKQSEMSTNNNKYYYRSGQLQKQVDFNSGTSTQQCWDEYGKEIEC